MTFLFDTHVLLLMVAMTCGACAVTQKELSEELSFPPLELIERNIHQTDITFVLAIRDVHRIETIGSYSSWEITAKVRNSLKGHLVEGTTIQYDRTIEGSSLALPIGSLHLVSFVWKEERFVIPDSGYHFPYSQKLRRQLEAKFP